MKRIMIFLILFLICFLCLISCDINKGKVSRKDDKQVSFVENISLNEMNYSNIDINEHIDLSYPYEIQGMFSRVIPLSYIEEQIGTVYLRKGLPSTYGVVKLRSDTNYNKYLFMLFDDQGYDEYYLIDGMMIGSLLEFDDFAGIMRGSSSFANVSQIDFAAILFRDYGEKGRGISYHRLSNGTIEKITYKKINNEYIVIEMENYDDPIGFINKLLPADLEAIKP